MRLQTYLFLPKRVERNFWQMQISCRQRAWCAPARTCAQCPLDNSQCTHNHFSAKSLTPRNLRTHATNIRHFAEISSSEDFFAFIFVVDALFVASDTLVFSCNSLVKFVQSNYTSTELTSWTNSIKRGVFGAFISFTRLFIFFAAWRKNARRRRRSSQAARR